MWIADPFTDSGPGQIILAVTGVIVAAGVLWKPIRGLTRIARSIRQFLDDWHGEPSRDGVPERDGVLKRIGHVEHLLNGGGFGAKIDRHIEEAAGHYAELVSRQDEIVTRLDALTEDVRDARSDTADTAVAAANALQRLDERFTDEVIASRSDTEKLRLAVQSMAQELGQESDTLPPGIPSTNLGDD